MITVNEFLNEIKNRIEQKIESPEQEDDLYCLLEKYILDNTYDIHIQNDEICQLAFSIQDEISEMEYMADNSIYIKK